MRPKISKIEIAHTVIDIDNWLLERIKQKGSGSLISINEIRGVIDEEYCELREEMHIKDYVGIEHELMDLAVAAIFGLASLRKLRKEGQI